MKIANPYSTELRVAHTSKLSEKVQLLVSNDRQHVTKTHRDTLALAYWTILFEYHHGILTLVRNGNPTSAFASLRVRREESAAGATFAGIFTLPPQLFSAQ